LVIAPSCGRFRFSREKVAGHGSNTTTGQATLHTTTTQPKQELCGIYTPEENSVKSNRFAGVSDAAAEREPAGEILSPNFGRRIRFVRAVNDSADPENQQPAASSQ